MSIVQAPIYTTLYKIPRLKPMVLITVNGGMN
jgi:hypothetical protein